MRLIAVVTHVVLLVLAPISARAELITFRTPDVAAGVECQGVNTPKAIPLVRYEELGVRVMTNEPFQNSFMCDPSQAFGFGGQWQPLVLGPGQTSYGPLPIWYMDGAAIEVTSLSGQPIRGVNLTIGGRNQGPWCAEMLKSAQGAITLCDHFSGVVTFADYGFADGLTSFRLTFPGGPVSDNYGDPFLLLRAINVPEPAGLLLLGLLALSRRHTGRLFPQHLQNHSAPTRSIGRG